MRAAGFGRRRPREEGEDTLDAAEPTTPETSPEEGEVAPEAESPVDPDEPDADAPELRAKAEMPSAPQPEGPTAELLRSRVQSRLLQRADVTILSRLPQDMLVEEVGKLVVEILSDLKVALDDSQRADLVTALVGSITNMDRTGGGSGEDILAEPPAGRGDGKVASFSSSRGPIRAAKSKIQAALMERIDVAAASALPRKELSRQISDVVVEILGELKIQLNLMEQRDLVAELLDDMLGLGPLEPLLADEGVTDIMVNGPKQVYVERKGKLELTDVTFRNNAHVMNIATRIVTRIGRRIDESQPLVDARLEDGSRVNIIAPPLAIDGASISIRKFARQKITLDIMARQKNLSDAIGKVLKIAARSRLNVLISGGTGSGKTTLLNAMSRLIDHGERVVTIEDAAELQLQQPHVVRLETRPPNLEGGGEITMRDLVKNALRMRPDRIILGEIRDGAALDMLQAMNTGHDGSMSTIHANNPREALTRLENMVAMAGVNLPPRAVRTQIASAVNMIVQVSRMRDGMRRIVSVAEVTGMEGDVITTQELFSFEFEGEGSDGKLMGTFRSSGLRPHFLQQAEYFGLGRALMECVA